MSTAVVNMDSVAREAHEGQVETIGRRLRRLRHERGLSQRELAGPGVSYAYISRIEAGARRPSVKALRMLARKLGVSADYLETGSELSETDERELEIADAELELRLAEQPQEAETRLASLRDEAVAAGDAVAASRAELALGLAAAGNGDAMAAIERLEAALETFDVSPSARPDVFEALGRVYSESGSPERAVELFERCLEEVASSAPEDLAAQVRYTSYLSHALTGRGELDRAQRVLDGALEQAEPMTDAYSRARLYWSLARLAELQGKAAAALDYIRRATALLDVIDDTLHLARAHLLCGSIMLSQGRVEGAAHHFDLAESLFGPNPEPEDRANLCTDQARLAIRLGRADEAVAHARAALAAAGDDYPTGRGNALWALAEGLSLTDDHDAADAAYREAAETLGEDGPRRDHAEAYRSWGTFLRRVGREDEALEVLERAADLAAEPAGEPQSPHVRL